MTNFNSCVLFGSLPKSVWLTVFLYAPFSLLYAPFSILSLPREFRWLIWTKDFCRIPCIVWLMSSVLKLYSAVTVLLFYIHPYPEHPQGNVFLGKVNSSLPLWTGLYQGIFVNTDKNCFLALILDLRRLLIKLNPLAYTYHAMWNNCLSLFPICGKQALTNRTGMILFFSAFCPLILL